MNKLRYLTKYKSLKFKVYGEVFAAMKKVEDISISDNDKIKLIQDPQSSPSSSFIGIIVSGCRYVVYRLTSFYLRTPLKLFKPARFDPLFYLRLLEQEKLVKLAQNTDSSNVLTPQRAKTNWTSFKDILRKSSLGILIRSLNNYGWKIIPQVIAPPLLANSLSGVVLYTSYLSFLPFPIFNASTSELKVNAKDAFVSGALAGSMQAIVSQPIEAIYQRSTMAEILSLNKTETSLWKFGLEKLKQTGLPGTFYGGFTLSLMKESLGFAIYFSSFEYLKYNGYDTIFSFNNEPDLNTTTDSNPQSQVKNSYLNKKTLQTFNAGVSAAFLLQVIQFPINKILKVHLFNLEVKNEYEFDILKKPIKHNWNIYSKSYKNTFKIVKDLCGKEQITFQKWMYKGFWRNTLSIIPGTTASLLALEYLRNYTRKSAYEYGSISLLP